MRMNGGGDKNLGKMQKRVGEEGIGGWEGQQVTCNFIVRVIHLSQPFDKTNLSAAGLLGSETLYFMTLKKRTDMISAALQQLVG